VETDEVDAATGLKVILNRANFPDFRCEGILAQGEKRELPLMRRAQGGAGRLCALPIYNRAWKGAACCTERAARSRGKMADLQGRIALVTGGAQGIGRAIAEELAAAGAVLALADVNEAKLAETVGELKTQGIEASAFTVNVSSEESIEAGAKAILEKFGKVEILVNNAGITRDSLMLRMKRADWDLVLGINLTGAFLLTQALLSPMLKNRWGRIVNIASVVGRAGQAGQVNYAASKAGLIGLTRSLAREVASRNITVNAVAPGYIETPMTAVLSEDVSKAMLATVPLGRRGTAKDVAQAVKFLASDAASYITGHVLDVNGGMFMGG
jgi:3-oxoacyl-[acyl-carrier protein] reductase